MKVLSVKTAPNLEVNVRLPVYLLERVSKHLKAIGKGERARSVLVSYGLVKLSEEISDSAEQLKKNLGDIRWARGPSRSVRILLSEEGGQSLSALRELAASDGIPETKLNRSIITSAMHVGLLTYKA